MRVGPVGSSVNALSLSVIGVVGVMTIMKMLSVKGSAEFTLEELREATVRIWRDPEKGYFTEARFAPKSPPIYRPISPVEASAWQIERPTSAMIAHAFQVYEPASY